MTHTEKDLREAIEDLWNCIGLRELNDLQPATLEVLRDNHDWVAEGDTIPEVSDSDQIRTLLDEWEDGAEDMALPARVRALTRSHDSWSQIALERMHEIHRLEGRPCSACPPSQIRGESATTPTGDAMGYDMTYLEGAGTPQPTLREQSAAVIERAEQAGVVTGELKALVNALVDAVSGDVGLPDTAELRLQWAALAEPGALAGLPREAIEASVRNLAEELLKRTGPISV